MKRSISTLIAVILIVVMSAAVGAHTIRVESTSIYNGDYGQPVSTYLEHTSNGNYMLFSGSGGHDYIVEYYDASYDLISTRRIPQELPLFGTFYSDGRNYYILSGQKNLGESPDVECFRLTKYDLSWNRVSSCGLYDCNTTEPFAFGSADIAAYGDYLVIRTCHVMYKSSDGVKHQANVTIVVDRQSMTITDSITSVAGRQRGYVSHSFNQLVEIDNGYAVCADHGDAYPRSIGLFVSPNKVTDGIDVYGWDYTEILGIGGGVGNYQTYAELTGLTVSDSSYLVAGSSIDQSVWPCPTPPYYNYDPSIYGADKYPMNAFLAVTNKDSGEVDFKWLTDDPESIAEGPYIVKIDDNRFSVMWENWKHELQYRFYDGSGNELGQLYTYSAGRLSDSEPIVVDGEIVWAASDPRWSGHYSHDLETDDWSYITTENDVQTDFYTISIEDGHFEAHEKGVKGFVERLYSVALGRPSDADGKANWISAITSGQESGGAVAMGFLTSVEFNNKNLPNEEFVRTLYRTFFDREADGYGLSYWVSMLEGGAPRTDIINGFINSTEWATLCWKYGIDSGGGGVPDTHIEPNEQIIGFATRLYTTCLVRDPDPAGLADWADRLANNQVSGSEAAYGFFFSDEFKVSNISNDEYVLRLYHTFMDREPDPAGFADWTGQLAAGASRESVFNGFTGSAEWALICSDYGILK